MLAGISIVTSLEGAPKKVNGYFHCGGNELTSLEGAPKKVGGSFYCDNNKLTSLEGVPNEVGGNFDCSYNSNLVLPKEKPSWLVGEFIQL